MQQVPFPTELGFFFWGQLPLLSIRHHSKTSSLAQFAHFTSQNQSSLLSFRAKSCQTIQGVQHPQKSLAHLFLPCHPHHWVCQSRMCSGALWMCGTVTAERWGCYSWASSVCAIYEKYTYIPGYLKTLSFYKHPPAKMAGCGAHWNLFTLKRWAKRVHPSSLSQNHPLSSAMGWEQLCHPALLCPAGFSSSCWIWSTFKPHREDMWGILTSCSGWKDAEL